MSPRSTKAGRKARQPRERERRRENAHHQRSTKAGRKARQPLGAGLHGSGDAARSTKAGRKARQPPQLRAAGARRVQRSTKAGRKARQPPPPTTNQPPPTTRSTKAGRKARQPPDPCRQSRPRTTALNEGRAKGPATAMHQPAVAGEHGVRSTKAGRKARQPLQFDGDLRDGPVPAQRRPGERPGNRLQPRSPSSVPRCAQRRPGERPGNRHRRQRAQARVDTRSTKAGRKARQPRRRINLDIHFTMDSAQRRPGERPGNRRPVWRDLHPTSDRSTKAGRKARQPPSSCATTEPRRRSLNEGRAKGPATAARAAGGLHQ